MYTIKHINQLIDKVKIRPFFFAGSSLPNHECRSLPGRTISKKYGKSSPSFQHDISLIHGTTVPF